jgi:hypothetical protein
MGKDPFPEIWEHFITSFLENKVPKCKNFSWFPELLQLAVYRMGEGVV